MKRFYLILFLLVIFSISVFAQVKPIKPTISGDSAVKSSPAYAEILLQKVTLEAELEDLLVAYTETFPKVVETRFRLNIIEQALNKILAVKPSESSKLTLALGKIILQKVEFEAEYEDLRKKYSDQHPDVKRAKRKVEIFDKAVKEILP